MLEIFKDIHSEWDAWTTAIPFIFLGIIIGAGIFLFLSRNDKTYFEGQIDAIRGNIKYRLVENELGESVWEEIEDMPEDVIDDSETFKTK